MQNISFRNINKLRYWSSPLEQFIIYSLCSYSVKIGDNLFLLFEFTNIDIFTTIFLIILFILCIGWYGYDYHAVKLIPNAWQVIPELCYSTAYYLLKMNVRNKEVSNEVFIQVVGIFFLLAGLNLSGLVCYTYSVTSSFVIALFLAISTYSAAIFIGMRMHGMYYFTIFYEEETPFYLAVILVPIEIVSYLARPISLGIRLFANMLAGHILLKILIYFTSPVMFGCGTMGMYSLIYILVLIILSLEFAVALIQAYVFATLICMNYNHAIELH